MKNKSKIIPIIFGSIGLIVLGIYVFPLLFGKKKELRFPDIVVSPDMNSTVISGQNLQIQFNEKKLNGVDSIIVKMNNVVFQNLKDVFTYSLASDGLSMGYHKVEITAYIEDYKKTIDLPFVIVSDITPVALPFTKVKVIAHDPKAYTQGLEIHDGVLYESAGNYGESSIRKIEINSGKILKNIALQKQYFGEGLTVLNGKIYQLTWKERTCIIYDASLQEIDKKTFVTTNGEGWGITNDGTSLILSDGSNTLTFIDPETFKIEKILPIYAGQNAVNYLNELEYVDGFIYANIYTTDQIAKIEASSGKVVGILQMDNLKKENPEGEVLNGIAYNKDTKTFIVTGKLWNKMYEIKL